MKKILLIEDDPFLIDIYNTKLKEEGFTVDIATDGQKGLRKIKEEKFDLVLLDIVLPQIDGWEILRKVKSQNYIPSRHPPAKAGPSLNVKIIVLSNLNQKAEVEKGLEMGATKYLIKAQYTPSEVVEEIKNILK